MTPYFIDLFFFYKTRYWKYSLQKSPVLLIMSWAIKIFLVLLILAQIGFALVVSAADLLPYRQLSMRKLFLSGLLLNLARNFYFPARYHRDIKKGMYYLFPVSGYTLNNMRMLETSSSIIFLASCNLLILPAFSRSPVYGFSLPFLAIGLCLLSLLVYDVAMVIFGKLWLFFATLVFFGAVVFLRGHTGLLHTLENLAPASPVARGAVVLALTAILYFLDTRLLIYTSIKNVPHE